MNTENLHNEATLERIERYYNNQLSATELKEFNLELQENESFKQLVEDYSLLFEGIETAGMKAQLDTFHEEVEIAEQTPKSSWRKLGVAASVIFLLGLSAFLLLNESKEEKLYTKYFKADPGLPTLMGKNTQYEFYNGMVSYKQGEYEKALSIWNKLDQNEISQDTLSYFKGIAYLANNQVDNAIKSLNATLKTKSDSFKNEAYYYLGLAHLKNEALELAKKNLNLSTIDDSQRLLNELAE